MIADLAGRSGVNRLIVLGTASVLLACGNATQDEVKATSEPTVVILECDVSLTMLDGRDITQRRTYKVDLTAKTLQFWDTEFQVWRSGPTEPRLLYETPGEISFEAISMLGRIEQTDTITFDRQIGAVDGTLRLKGPTMDQTSNFGGPCKAVAAPGLNNAF